MMEVSTTVLLNYGILGIWTTSLLYERWKWNTKFTKVIEKNTETQAEVLEALRACRKR